MGHAGIRHLTKVRILCPALTINNLIMETKLLTKEETLKRKKFIGALKKLNASFETYEKNLRLSLKKYQDARNSNSI